jgi:hypothetical protein
MIRVWVLAALAANVFNTPNVFRVQFGGHVAGRTVAVCLDGRTIKNSFAGKLSFRDAKGSWTSYCANVRGPMSKGQVFPVQELSSKKVGGAVAIAGNIVAKYFKLAQDADQCAGLQLAIWEAIEDGGLRPNFSSGRFQARATPIVMAYAEEFYSAAEISGEALYLQTGSGGGSGQSQITML